VFFGRKAWSHNVEIFKQVTNNEEFDLIIGDEIYEIMFAVLDKGLDVKYPTIMIQDFISGLSLRKNPLEKIYTYILNRKLARFGAIPKVTHFFVGELEDIPDKPMGCFLPNARNWAKEYCKFLGHVIRFNPSDYKDKEKIRNKLGYGPEPLVICALGGSEAGQDLLTLCAKAYPIVKATIPDLHMVLCCGARLNPDALDVPSGIEVRSYIPELYEHYAACDLAVIVGGGTTSTELTALKKPFIFFPLEKQFDQYVYISERLARYNAGIKMLYYETTPEMLAEKIINNIGKEVNYGDVPVNGAQNGAKLIKEMIYINDQ